MQVKDLMTKKLGIITPEATLAEAAALMKMDDCGFLPVIEKEKIIGAITDRDIVVRAVAEHKSTAKAKVRDHMTKDILYCYEDDSIKNTQENMLYNGVHRLPVLDENKKLVGVISRSDIDREMFAGEKMARDFSMRRLTA